MLRAYPMQCTTITEPRTIMLTLRALQLYPIKAIAGITLDVAAVELRGLRGDRCWLLVDADGRFLSQRELPALGAIEAALQPGGLMVTAAGMPPLALSQPTGVDRIAVTVWSDTVQALLAEPAANQWFSTLLGQAVRAVFMDAAATRPLDPACSLAGDEVSFADGFPLLIANESSLADLNARIGEPLAMARFRPNLVINGAEPWAEDGWRRLRIGAIEMDLVKPCSRCQVTTLDPSSGVPHPHQEPLRTLARFRKQNGKVMFGVNAIARGTGELRCGQPVEVLA